jgi:glycosyltransferase involved in cell wall biosynthesis
MKITIVIDELDMGGAQHVVYNFIKNVDRRKYYLTIILTEGKVYSLLEDEISKMDIPLIFLNKFKYTQFCTRIILMNKLFNKILYLYSEILTILQTVNAVKNSKPQIVFAHQRGIWSAYWSIFHDIFTVTTIHTVPQSTFSRPSEDFIFRLSLRLNKNIVVAISEYNYKLICDYWRLKKKYTRIVNNGIDLNNYYHKEHTVFSFINVSRHDENKNQSLILKAFSMLVINNPKIPVLLYLVGDGVTHDLLRQEAKKLNIENSVIFTGYVDSPADLLAVSDVYVSSSHREGLPLSMLEAMASQLPVISTNVGGISDIIGENGILIDDNDELGLYNAMQLLFKNSEIRELKGRKSMEIVKNFSSVSMTEKYCKIFDEFNKKNQEMSR